MAFDLTPLDLFDPSSYPTRRNEEWKYSDLSRALREAPARADLTHIQGEAGDFGGFYWHCAGDGQLNDLQAAVSKANGRLYLDMSDVGEEGAVAGYQGEGRIALGAGESLILLEDYSGALDYASSTVLHFDLAEGASLVRVVILDEPESAVSVRRSTVTTAPNSTFKQYVFSTGAKFQRFETHVTHAGHGAHVEMNGAYLLKDTAHFDYTTRVNHAEIDGTTGQLIKGLVKDRATAVFQGRIYVEKGADGTDARMRHQALMLNDGAHVRAKPELEIYADDVQCAHGNTIGAMDDAALFFCRSRGMPEETARALLMQAFVVPVAEQIEDEALREMVLNWIEDKAGGFYAL
ncbi:SufD family Fe-S cluster assembly protein [Asticcacaulis sp. AND118]|uniref:SufB/SufD family protein n=1 Tax=Asticcacaulis sp. AND118 TaxID=2840468 RepID=UPI001D000303|nr:SufD family Fe-S cluster assembly protein [Asticcacaulis sp. AND118]UDF02251.1 SufD family Fe-S cluster assembly protein [Asticcacaulis sp. AND118]